MKTKDLNIIKEEEVLEEMSMDTIKGGLNGESQLCCIANSNCNKNSKGQSNDSLEQLEDNGAL